MTDCCRAILKIVVAGCRRLAVLTVIVTSGRRLVMVLGICAGTLMAKAGNRLLLGREVLPTEVVLVCSLGIRNQSR